MLFPEISRSMLKNAAVLGLFAVVTVGGVTLLQQGTADRIQAAERNAQMRALAEILPAGSYDNHLLDNAVPVNDPLLGSRRTEQAYLALKEGRPSAVILPATAPDGYSGAIRLLVGVNADGTLAGVRTLQHHETPGLGDKIELAKSDWILGFTGKSADKPEAAGWAVKKDGGEFDQFAGATITPRAVVGAVHRALQYFAANRAQLLGDDGTTAATPDLINPLPAGEPAVHSRADAAATRDEMHISEPEERRP